MQILKVTDEAFRPYGKVITIDVSDIIRAMENAVPEGRCGICGIRGRSGSLRQRKADF